MNTLKRKRTISETQVENKPKRIMLRIRLKKDMKDWICATATRNYILKDPLLDWLKYNYSSVINNPSYTNAIVRAKGSKSQNNFTEFIMEQGKKFESHVIGSLYTRFGSDVVVNIGGDLNPKSKVKVQETIDAMDKGVPIIYSGLLHNEYNKTYGIPDLIVRSDWINDLVSVAPLTDREETIPAKKLKNYVKSSRSGMSPPYHYRIIDIKFSTINLRSDSVHILNSGSFPAYKSQLCIYNDALSRVQGYNPRKAYILGRTW